MTNPVLGRCFAAAFAACAVAAPSLCAAQSAPVTAEEARAISIDAYVYFYPLVTMDVSRKQFTNIEPGKEFGKGPMNTFVSVPEYPPANFKGVVRPNFDTLYSLAWLDLTKEPAVISAPDTAGRYYLLPMLDMWTDVFASPGWRTTGTQAGHFLVTPPGWTGAVPAGVTRISAPTSYVWIIGRTKTDGPPDYEAVHKIQARLQGHAALRLGQGAEAGRGEDRSDGRHEDAARGPSRRHAGRPIFRLRGRAPEAQSAPPHRRADPRPDAAHRHRGGRELRHRQSPRGGARRSQRGAGGGAEASWNGSCRRSPASPTAGR